MCGLFGAIGKSINPLIIRGLAIANRTRGKESLGMFDSTGKKIKSASDPTVCLTRSNFSAFIARKHWFIAGHTRKATRGVVNKKNAHPFRFGNYIGAHNGQCIAPAQYDVDSQYLFDQLHKNSGNYAEAFKGIAGYWALTWFDGKHFYLQAHDNKLTLARKGGTWYYSSDKDHLSAAIGKADEWITLEDGATIRFSAAGKMEKLEAFKSTAGRGGYYKAATSGYSKPAAGTGLQVVNHSGVHGTTFRSYGNGYDHERGMSNYNQMLTTSEYTDAEEWALELGYNGFYAYMKTENYHNEYSAYGALNRAKSEMEDQEYEDAEYEIWDAERCEAENLAGTTETDFPDFDSWLANKEEAEWAAADKHGADNEYPDFQAWSEARDAEDARQLRIRFDGREMDDEFDRLCDRDEVTKYML